MTSKIDPFKISKELIVDKLITINQLTVPVYTSLPMNSTFAGQLAALRTATGADLYYFDGDYWHQVVDSATTGGLPSVLAIDNTSGGQSIVMQAPGVITSDNSSVKIAATVSATTYSPVLDISSSVSSRGAHLRSTEYPVRSGGANPGPVVYYTGIDPASGPPLVAGGQINHGPSTQTITDMAGYIEFTCVGTTASPAWGGARDPAILAHYIKITVNFAEPYPTYGVGNTFPIVVVTLTNAIDTAECPPSKYFTNMFVDLRSADFDVFLFPDAPALSGVASVICGLSYIVVAPSPY